MDEIVPVNSLTIPKSALFSDWSDYLALLVRAGKLTETTRTTYQAGMRKFTEWAEGNPDKTGALVILEWQAAMLEHGYKHKSVNLWLAGVKSFYSWALQSGRLDHDPTQGIKQEKVKRAARHERDILTGEEMRRLLAQAARDQSPAGIRNQAIIYLLAFSGMRSVEVYRSNYEDIQPKGGRMVLMLQGKGHTSKDDYIVINERLEPALYSWLEIRGNQPGALFVSLSDRSKGERLSLRAIRAIVKQLYQAAGIIGEHKSTHSLRHTVATHLLAKGVPPQRVMQVTRHKDVSTLMIYYHDLERLSDPAEDVIDYD